MLNSTIITFSGTVIKGLGQAKKLALPTINLNPKFAPKSFRRGVYAAIVKTPVGIFPGALYFGPRFAPPCALVLEVHCIGLKKNLYRKRVTVEIKKRLRKVLKFATAAKAKTAIKKDANLVRSFISLPA